MIPPRIARALAVLLAVLPLLLWTRGARADDPPVGDERVVLHTVAGDIVLALYPTVAPKTVEQILKLVRGGVYDTTAFVRIEPGFVAQLSAHWDRSRPLDDAQKALVRKLPAEFSETVKHGRGTLSMAREDADVNSAETSFSILLAAAPHLDGKYTVFGRVESGMDVVEEMVKVPRGPNARPVVRLDVVRAEVVPASAIPMMRLAPARRVHVPDQLATDAARAAAGGASTGGALDAGRTEIAVCLAFICLVGLVSFFLQGRVPASVHGSLNLVVVLISAFVLVIVLTPQGRRSPWLAAAMFFGLIGLFKVLGRFERPWEAPSAPKAEVEPKPDK